jgi:recombination protein RecR
MIFSSSLLEEAVKEFAKLPGIGKKTALRLVLHLIRQEEGSVMQFSDAIARLRQEIRFCKRCHNIADSDLCKICSNTGRKQQLVCVVENLQWSISCSRWYYFSP